MTTLNLVRNNLVGEIPPSFKNFTSLSGLFLARNNLSNLSSALQILQHLPNLTSIILTKNFLGGKPTPPKGIRGFANLEELVLSECALSGSFPPWLANLAKLKFLDISWNYLTGTIPSWFGNFDNLFYLDISNNSLTGEIPISLTLMKSLVCSNSSRKSSGASPHTFPFSIDRNFSGKTLRYNQFDSFPPSIILSNNKLVGSILPEFNGLANLHVLDLSFNDISGTIPDLSGMSNLETLDLSHNHLTGTIPPSLSRLNFLSSFDVAYNNLSGKIPTGGQFDTFDNPSIYIGNYYLCGPPTKNNCSNGVPNPNPKTEDNNETEKTWLYLGMELGFATGLWGVCGILIFKKSWSDAYFRMINELFDKIYVIIAINMRKLNERVRE